LYPTGYNKGVESTPREVTEYLTEAGISPFNEWLKNLRDIRARAIIRKRINRIRLGNFGNCKHLGGGVYELKIYFGPGYRVYYGVDDIKLVVLLCGGDKSSQNDDIKQARDFWADYLR